MAVINKANHLIFIRKVFYMKRVLQIKTVVIRIALLTCLGRENHLSGTLIC